MSTQQQVQFLVQSEEGIIPPDTHFAWHVVPVSGEPLPLTPLPPPHCVHTLTRTEASCFDSLRMETSDSTFSITFPCWGTYDVSVVGNHSAGSFAAQLSVKAQGKASLSYIQYASVFSRPAVINDLTLSGIPTVSRSGAMVTVSVHRQGGCNCQLRRTHHSVSTECQWHRLGLLLCSQHTRH